MKSVNFPESNVLNKKNPCFPESEDTHVWKMNNCEVMCFQPTDEETAAIAAGAPVWLMIAAAPSGGTVMRLSTVSPFLTPAQLQQ